MTNLERVPSSDGESAICASSLNNSSSTLVERLRAKRGQLGPSPAQMLQFMEGISPLLAEAAALISELQAESDKAKAKLAYLVDAIEYHDSYGVHGSDFMCCHLCNAGGAPGVKFEHDSHCPVLRCEPIAAMWWEERNEEWKSIELESHQNLTRALAVESALSHIQSETVERAISAIETVVNQRDDLGHVHFVELSSVIRSLNKGGEPG